jgi:hypothetical protein
MTESLYDPVPDDNKPLAKHKHLKTRNAKTAVSPPIPPDPVHKPSVMKLSHNNLLQSKPDAAKSKLKSPTSNSTTPTCMKVGKCETAFCSQTPEQPSLLTTLAEKHNRQIQNVCAGMHPQPAEQVKPPPVAAIRWNKVRECEQNKAQEASQVQPVLYDKVADEEEREQPLGEYDVPWEFAQSHKRVTSILSEIGKATEGTGEQMFFVCQNSHTISVSQPASSRTSTQSTIKLSTIGGNENTQKPTIQSSGKSSKPQTQTKFKSTEQAKLQRNELSLNFGCAVANRTGAKVDTNIPLKKHGYCIVIDYCK